MTRESFDPMTPCMNIKINNILDLTVSVYHQTQETIVRSPRHDRHSSNHCGTVFSVHKWNLPSTGKWSSHTIVVLLYQQISTDDLNDTAIKTAIQNYLAKIYLGLAPEYAAVSCKHTAELKPHYDSGYYWIKGVSGAVGVYCEMNPPFGAESGGWMRIADIDTRNYHSRCPPGLIINVTEGTKFCSKPSLAPGCSSTIFTTREVEYSMVCGRVIGYQYFNTNGLGPSRFTPGIDQTYMYVDGVSITHGSQRQHVWTFAAANNELVDSQFCTNILPVHVFTHHTLSKELSPVLLVMTTSVKLAAEHKFKGATTLMTLSGMVRGVKRRMSAVSEGDRGSVSSYLSQPKTTLS